MGRGGHPDWSTNVGLDGAPWTRSNMGRGGIPQHAWDIDDFGWSHVGPKEPNDVLDRCIANQKAARVKLAKDKRRDRRRERRKKRKKKKAKKKQKRVQARSSSASSASSAPPPVYDACSSDANGDAPPAYDAVSATHADVSEASSSPSDLLTAIAAIRTRQNTRRREREARHARSASSSDTPTTCTHASDAEHAREEEQRTPVERIRVQQSAADLARGMLELRTKRTRAVPTCAIM